MNMMWHTNSSLGIKIASLGTLFLLFSISLGLPLVKAASFVLENQDVDYEIEGGTVTDMVLDSDFIELIVSIDSTNDGILQISFPRVILDAKFNDVDDIFFVIVDGFQTEYVEITNDVYSRTLIIPFFAGDTQIEIIGTTLLEESLQEFISEPEIEIPAWIKNNAGWWADDLIGDSDFVSGIQYLITEKIMTIPTTPSGTSSSEEIPAWIKNNAGWWADDLIGDSDFVSGIQYLITEGIMSV
jgi:hypothetical protein